MSTTEAIARISRYSKAAKFYVHFKQPLQARFMAKLAVHYANLLRQMKELDA
jgi:hypothetical protein